MWDFYCLIASRIWTINYGAAVTPVFYKLSALGTGQLADKVRYCHRRWLVEITELESVTAVCKTTIFPVKLYPHSGGVTGSWTPIFGETVRYNMPLYHNTIWCRKWDLNPYAFPQKFLRLPCLPFQHSCLLLSGLINQRLQKNGAGNRTWTYTPFGIRS